MKKSYIYAIVLFSGFIRIKKKQKQKLNKEFFNGKQPNLCINPDEVVAY